MGRQLQLKEKDCKKDVEWVGWPRSAVVTVLARSNLCHLAKKSCMKPSLGREAAGRRVRPRSTRWGACRAEGRVGWVGGILSLSQLVINVVIGHFNGGYQAGGHQSSHQGSHYNE